eukprot:PITA_26680
MEIKRDQDKRKLWLSQRKYVETIMRRLNMKDSKLVKVPIPVGVRLSTEQCPKTQEEEEDMSHVPYASVVGSLMYAMVYTRTNIAHAVGVLSRFMSKLGKEHWTTSKQVFRLGFIKSEADENLYQIVVKGKLLIVVLYVDDLILNDDDHLNMYCKEDLAREFKMKDMGLVHYFLGMEVSHKDGELFVSQGKYANEIIGRFHKEKDVDILTKALSKCKFEFHRDKIGVADNPFLVEREC